jgi:hypothetical protein
MPDIKRADWLEDLLRTKGFHYNAMIKFAGIYMTDRLDRKDVFGVFAQYRDHKREYEQYPYADGIYISREMTEGNPLHELCTAAHEVGHFKLQSDGPEFGNSEAWAETYAEVFLHEFFPPKLAKQVYKIHKYGEDPCVLAGVRERATVLIKGTTRQKIVGSRILAYLDKRPDKSVGLGARIVSLQERLGRMK